MKVHLIALLPLALGAGTARAADAPRDSLRLDELIVTAPLKSNP